MSGRIQQSQSTAQTNKSYSTESKSTVGIVIDVIKNITQLSEGVVVDGTDSNRTDLVGGCLIRPITDAISSHADLKVYKPIDSYSIDLPIKGEMVELLKLAGTTYYKRLPNPNLNTGNAVINRDTKTYGDSASTQGSDYKTTSQTGISNSDGPSQDRKTNFGEYFEPNQINPLNLYEGDKVIQSRFGQSVRFSGYNNTDNIFSPTILIRNRQNDLEKLNGELIEEDINRDGSTILLSSNQYKLDFQPGLVDDGGSSDFETIPIKAKLPKEYVGFDHMLLNSERIIISAKSQEMLFFSKGNYGFISDGKFTIDNGNGGADLDFGDDVNITTDRNNTNLTILTGTGNILLNTTQKNERVVRGDTLVELLGELIDAINKQVYNTPAGPSAAGPTNRSTFNDIKSKLQDALSTLNYTE
jgi:hypothetical protein